MNRAISAYWYLNNRRGHHPFLSILQRAIMDQKRPKIVILGDYEEIILRNSNWTYLNQNTEIIVSSKPMPDEDHIFDAVSEADAIVVVRDRIPFKEPLISRLSNLKLFVFTGQRNGALDANALISRGIAIGCTNGGPTKDTTTEHTWALILSAAKRIVESSKVMVRGTWRDESSVVSILHGQRLGVIGLGSIGSRVARIGAAFGMEVITWSPNMTEERAAAENVKFVSLEELLSTSKVVSLHLVAGPTVAGLLGAERLALMRTDSILVNTSRASLVNTPALVAALAAGRPGQAAVDVFDVEPLPPDDPLRNTPNLLVTPHTAHTAAPVFETFSKGITANLEAWLKGEPLPHPYTP